MPGRRPYLVGCVVVVATALADCTQQPPPDLSASLKGIDKAKFLSCSGPPLLDYPRGSQEQMSFVTDLRRGSDIGIAGPGALTPASCSVDTVFQDNRLVTANFSGDQSMCTMVFAPCLRK